MIPPVRRGALAARHEQDRLEEREVSAAESLEARVALSLELSELSLEAARSLRAAWTTTPPDDLAEKAARLARPLRLLAERPRRR